MKLAIIKTYVCTNLGRAVALSCLVGLITACAALVIQPSKNAAIWAAGNFFSTLGNDLFLIGSNFLIIGWAYRKRLPSIMKLTLLLDLLVWVSVQGLKYLQLGTWYLRPNGGTGGFPSGHATHAFAMAFLLTLYFPRFAWFWYSCAALISWSRVETDWHTGIQVTAGIILGITLVWLLTVRWVLHPEAVILRPQPTQKQSQPLPVQQSYATE